MKKCKIKECGKTHRARGWCSKHYARWERHGNPHTSLLQREHTGRCSFERCFRPYCGKGVCAYHYSHAIYRLKFNKIQREYAYSGRRDPQKRLNFLYRDMLARVSGGKGRRRSATYKHLPLLPKKVFLRWANSTGEYPELFSAWEISGFKSKLAPTLIRVDKNEGYVLGNIRWVTKSEACMISGKIRQYGSKNYEA